MYTYARKDGEKDKEIMYWRKHNRLHRWMEELWRTKREEAKKAEEAKSLEDKFLDALDKVNDPYDDVFNCVELELDEYDLDSLENDLEEQMLPETRGSFGDSYQGYTEYYKESDDKFIKEARKYMEKGYKIIYDSSW